jgi:hypothetical protein
MSCYYYLSFSVEIFPLIDQKKNWHKAWGNVICLVISPPVRMKNSIEVTNLMQIVCTSSTMNYITS